MTELSIGLEILSILNFLQIIEWDHRQKQFAFRKFFFTNKYLNVTYNNC